VSRDAEKTGGPGRLALALRAARRAAAYYFLVTLRALVLVVPERLAHAMFRFVADLAFVTIGIHRRRAIAHLRIAYPEMSSTQARLVAKRMTRHLARNAVEFIRLPRMPKQRLVEMVTIEGHDTLKQLAREGRGAIAITAHFGNWELLAAAMSAMGYGVTIVARRVYYDKFERLLRGMRRLAGVPIVHRDRPREMLRMLRAGRFLGVMLDVDVEKVESVYVEFFGRLALTPVGPVALALRTGLPLLPCFIVRNEQARGAKGPAHTIFIEPPLRLIRTGDEQKDLLVNTMRATRAIERAIRRCPDQWMWIHRRWQHQPAWPFLSTPHAKPPSPQSD
jgi:KDO2-lipid IV(A) lauroyltransferase